MENKRQSESIEIWTGDIPGYRLLDSGNKRKLEEVGGIRIIRPEPRAWWNPRLAGTEWDVAVASSPDFTPSQTKATTGKQQLASGWKIKDKVNRSFAIDTGIDGIKANIELNDRSRHIGIFPEQAKQWEWIRDRITKHEARATNKKLNVLNLFGYTGIASLVAAKAGANVTHVDGSKHSIEWARENQKQSHIAGASIRWILDDAVKFLKREVRRKSGLPKDEAGYDAIIMDPPSYGRGPKGEIWKVEDKLPELLELCKKLLNEKPLFVILNMYSTELSSISISNILRDMMQGFSDNIIQGELAIKETGLPQHEDGGRLLPLSIFAIWDSEKTSK